MIELLKQFPALWATIGLLVGGGVMFWVTKKFGHMRSDALNEVVNAYKAQVQAQIELSKTQSEQHMVTLEMQKNHWGEELAKLEKSRDEYKQQLHSCRNDLGIENTELKLKIQELEMRPTVEVLQSETQAFYRDMSNTLKGIAESMKSHDDKSQERFEELVKSLRKTA
jgi:hypothetical protein